MGLAELESLYGADAVLPVDTHAALLDVQPAKVAFANLGGTMKFCKVLTELDTTDWQDIEAFLVQAAPRHVALLPAGKMRLGISVYGLSVTPKQIMATGLTTKKAIRATGRSVRLIPNVESTLNSAQVLHNRLTGPLGWELLFVRNGDKTICAQSIAVQDITAYASRDRGRPKRDARIGMLPPKLAQTIVNLAAGPSGRVDPICQPGEGNGKTLLDPFCGTGVVLLEATLMGYRVYGSDIEPRMIEYSKANLEWLGVQNTKSTFEIGDATIHHWQNSFDVVASEVYLGRPFTAQPDNTTLKDTISTCNLITKRFLQNLAKQSEAGLRLCLALPAWKVKGEFKHLPLLDHIEDMGYNRVSFVHAAEERLIYHREGQIVGRELTVLIRM